MLRKAKQDSISEKVIECGRDLKQLYKLVEHLTGTKADNALPCRSSNEDLANEFAIQFNSNFQFKIFYCLKNKRVDNRFIHLHV